MKRPDIEQEVQRLAPWYYAFDLAGVSTTLTAPFDQHGHRRVDLAAISADRWRGKTVLDVGCNEGGWSFSALEHGAAGVHAFDVREVNVEKARFVASVKGYERITFGIDSCDSWIERRTGETYDFVFLCGLLYHLVEPWRTIEQYSAVAREGVLVSTLLYGGADGYTPFPEIETIGASEDPQVLSMMPNTLNTLFLEFAKHGLYPRYFWESRYGDYWGTCNVWFERWHAVPGAFPWRSVRRTGRAVFVGLHPRSLEEQADGSAKLGLEIALYNETHEPVAATARLELCDVHGVRQSSSAPLPIELPPRPSKGDPDRAATVFAHEVLLPGPCAGHYLEVRLLGAGSEELPGEDLSGEELGGAALWLPRRPRTL